MKKEQKIEIEVKPIKIGYEIIIEENQLGKYLSIHFDSRQKLDGFLEGFKSAVSFLSLKVQVEIRGREKLEETK